MRQFQFDYVNEDSFVNQLKKIKSWCDSNVVANVVFQIYTEELSDSKIGVISALIEKILPEAVYMGSSTNGNIIMGEYGGTDVTIVCTVYEFASTKIKLLHCNLSDIDNNDAVESVVKEINGYEWVKSVTLFSTINGMNMKNFCETLSGINNDIQIFGGGAFAGNMDSHAAFVFSSEGGLSERAAVFLLVGGEDYYVKTKYIEGWKPIGREFFVTKANGTILYELDGKPAYEIYHKYLNVKSDEVIYQNLLEFPLVFEGDGVNLLRAPSRGDKDGALVMSANVMENVKVRMTYGSPETILDSVNKGAESFCDFCPEVINVFSCAARRIFWGTGEVSRETQPFQSLAPTSGFYTSGEFLSTNGKVNQHNVTLVVAGQREGKPGKNDLKDFVMVERAVPSGSANMITRMATCINELTREYNEVVERLKKYEEI